MRTWWTIAAVIVIIYGIGVVTNIFFNRKDKTKDDTTPPDDRYPLF